MTFGIGPSRRREPPRLTQVCVIWRAYRLRPPDHQFITAALYAHPHGEELRVFLGEEQDDNLLHSQVAPPAAVDALREKAASLRQVLLENGWSEVPATPPVARG